MAKMFRLDTYCARRASDGEGECTHWTVVPRKGARGKKRPSFRDAAEAHKILAHEKARLLQLGGATRRLIRVAHGPRCYRGARNAVCAFAY